MIEEHLHRPEALPAYWLEAAEAFDAGDDGTRIWEVPGSDFASYRWGNTVDPITPGLIERGYVARELVPFGSAESADLLTAFDRKLQEGSLESASVGPIARLLSVGDLVHRADLTYERFRTPRPVLLRAFQDYPAGHFHVSARQHDEVLQAVRSRDAEWAEVAMRNHIMAGRNAIMPGELPA